jgi:hypothetical protein
MAGNQRAPRLHFPEGFEACRSRWRKLASAVLFGVFSSSLAAPARASEPSAPGLTQQVVPRAAIAPSGQLQPGGTERSTLTAASRPGPPEGTLRQAAGWVQQADRHFRKGNPAAAIPLLERAYRSTGWTGCLLNLGMAHHSLSECQAARDYYERYLDLEAYSERRIQVESALEELERSCAPRMAPPLARAPEVRGNAIAPLADAVGPMSNRSMQRVAPEPRASVARVGQGQRTLALMGFGLAGATGLAALTFVVSGERYDREAQRFEDLGRTPDNDSVARALDRDGRRANTWAVAFGAASVLLLGTSAGLLWLGESAGSGTLSLSLSPGASRMSYQARF